MSQEEARTQADEAGSPTQAAAPTAAPPSAAAPPRTRGHVAAELPAWNLEPPRTLLGRPRGA